MKPDDPLDKYKDHILGNCQLVNQRDQEYFEKMSFVWSMATRMFSPQQILVMLKEKYSHEKSQAYKIIKDSYSLFGDINEVSKQAAKKLLIEGAHYALQVAMANRDSEMMLKAIHTLHKLYEFDKVDDSNIPPANARMAPGTRIYETTNNIQNNYYGDAPEGKS